ncbi:MAG: DUF4358 domain-containing protein [Emergencia sp.]
MKKKIIFILILAAFLVLVYTGQSARDVSVDAIEEQLLQETGLNRLEKCSDRQLMQFFGLDCESYEGFIYYKSGEALGVEELLIVKAAQKDDLTAVTDAVEGRVRSQIRTYEGYGPEQTAMLKNAIIITRGNFLFYCTAGDPESFREVFDHVI